MQVLLNIQSVRMFQLEFIHVYINRNSVNLTAKIAKESLGGAVAGKHILFKLEG